MPVLWEVEGSGREGLPPLHCAQDKAGRVSRGLCSQGFPDGEAPILVVPGGTVLPPQEAFKGRPVLATATWLHGQLAGKGGNGAQALRVFRYSIPTKCICARKCMVCRFHCKTKGMLNKQLTVKFQPLY